MTDYRVAAQLAGVPEKLIWKMHRAGIIANPLPDDELRGLAMLSAIWRTEWFCAWRLPATLMPDAWT